MFMAPSVRPLFGAFLWPAGGPGVRPGTAQPCGFAGAAPGQNDQEGRRQSMLQTIVVVILLAIDGWIVLTNPAAVQTSILLRTSSSSAQVYSVTIRMLFEAAGAALIILWIAGLIDRASLDRRVEQYERTVRFMNEKMMQVKSRAYDDERQPLEDICVRLDALDRDIRALRARMDREPPAPAADATRVVPAETRIVRDKTA
jgi:hypothetical protein